MARNDKATHGRLKNSNTVAICRSSSEGSAHGRRHHPRRPMLHLLRLASIRTCRATPRALLNRLGANAPQIRLCPMSGRLLAKHHGRRGKPRGVGSPAASCRPGATQGFTSACARASAGNSEQGDGALAPDVVPGVVPTISNSPHQA